MIIIKVMGGLGNQMFQYAFYLKLNHLGKQVKLDLSGYDEENQHRRDKREFELFKFQNLKITTCTKIERSKFIDDNMLLFSRIRRKVFGNKTNIFREEEPYNQKYYEINNGYLLGYWTCEKYYEDIYSELRKAFIFPELEDKRNIDIREEILLKKNSVSVHIRRGDYLSERHKERFGSICTIEYYKAAIDYMKSKLDNPYFYFFSDDPEYVRENYTDRNMTIVDWNNDGNSINDMHLMSLCKNNICANSTFSKWAAILNSNPVKIRIMPLKHTKEEMYSISDMREWWKNWVFVDEKENIYS